MDQPQQGENGVSRGSREWRWFAALGVVLVGGIVLLFAKFLPTQESAEARGDGGSGTRVVARSPDAAGRYLVLVGGCNDCHTPGFMQKGMEVPESEWLTGVNVGWRGPWGTTYAPNLRLSVDMFNEDAWVGLMRTRKALPPMPWPSLSEMSDPDLRAVYKYIKSLGAKGERMPAAVPPGVEPKTPYIDAMPQMPKAK